MAKARFSGLFAALPTPLAANGRLDLDTLDRLIAFVVEGGADGVCIGGATSEFPHFETEDRIAVIRRAAAQLPNDRALLVGIGDRSVAKTLELGRAAFEAGSRAVLLPMPLFFAYEQDDLAAYCTLVSDTLRAPVLLYDLPLFTTPIAPETAIALMRDQEFIAGIKDSSGHEDNITRFARAREDAGWSLFVGDDRLIARGLEAGWNGSISGLAAFCPELLSALYHRFIDGRRDESARLQERANELMPHISGLPAPWAIRVALAARGLDTGPLPLPLSPRRETQIRAFRDWFSDWLGRGVTL